MANEPEPVPELDPWVIPLHGIEAPGREKPKIEEPPSTAYLFNEDELPTIEFRPRLRRSA